MKSKFFAILITSSLIFIINATVTACDCYPPCEGCQLCLGGECADMDYKCPNWPGEICLDGDCICILRCCEDSDCGPPLCWYCENWNCVFLCNTSNCQDCIGGFCQSVCEENECCDDGTCVDKCAPDGDYCYFVWPPLQTPPGGCTNPDTTTHACESYVDGAICAWVQTKAYHLDSAKCAECEPSCKHPSGDPCVELTPWKCNNDIVLFLGLVCTCNDDITFEEDAIDLGVHFECN